MPRNQGPETKGLGKEKGAFHCIRSLAFPTSADSLFYNKQALTGDIESNLFEVENFRYFVWSFLKRSAHHTVRVCSKRV